MSDLTPAQRIEAAIVRLEELKGMSTPGPWEHLRDSDRDLADVGPIVESLIVAGDNDSVLDWGSGVREPDADLIVTLHATIDAQLAILMDTLNLFRDPIPLFAGHEEQICAAQLALADAIISGGTE